MNAPKLNPARERHWVCARRLRERRLALGLTQREVVARLGHQTTNRTLSVMENGRQLDLGLLPDLATALECTVTYLLGLTDDPSAWQPAINGHSPPMRNRENGTGILGPGVPADFAAPVRVRRRLPTPG